MMDAGRDRDAGGGEAWLERQCRSGPNPIADQRELSRSFQWHDGLLIGHDDIDEDHRRFFSHFAALARQMDGSIASSVLERLFAEVLADLGRHLTAEEDILDRIGFPGRSVHQTSHRVLDEQARAALAIGRDGEWGTALRLLATAVLEHIAEDDAKLRSFLAVATPRIL